VSSSSDSARIGCPAGQWTVIWQAGGLFAASRSLTLFDQTGHPLPAAKATLSRACVGIPPYYEIGITGSATLVWATEPYLQYRLKPLGAVIALLGPI
jgi:hypothetical protein